jgi:phosphatidyl-myo-inositol dimannoside synthase
MAGPDEAPALERPPGFPATLLGLVERGASDDDVSYAGAVLERALAELAPHSRTITVFPDQEGGADASFTQRGLFAARLMSGGRRADCVVYNHVGVATAQSSIPAGLRRPYAVLVHGAEAWDTGIDAPRRRALAGATLRIASSAYAARRVAEAHPDTERPDVLQPTLLPEPDGSPVDGALVSSITPRTIVIAARMTAAERGRGHDELLEAWPTILGRRPDARLALVGRGDDVKRLEAKANGLGLAGSVRFTGHVSESTLEAMLLKAGGFALPGREEGSGVGYLRAMRAGLPCIAGADDAAGELVDDGRTGMLVPAADRDALAQAVISLLGDSVRRRSMGDAGRARFDQHFSFARFRDHLDTMLRAAFPARPRR